eukprot:m.61122 g.61122  ORF g.61122 m.61122 type:complete len:616 (+) comp7061_c0_seq2:1104-2951(+)
MRGMISSGGLPYIRNHKEPLLLTLAEAAHSHRRESARSPDSDHEARLGPRKRARRPIAVADPGGLKVGLETCPVCFNFTRTRRDVRNVDGHCHACYTLLWRDASRIAKGRTPPTVTGDITADLQTFLEESQHVGRRCRNLHTCEAIARSNPPACTRCRTARAIRLLPDLAHRLFCAAVGYSLDGSKAGSEADGYGPSDDSGSEDVQSRAHDSLNTTPSGTARSGTSGLSGPTTSSQSTPLFARRPSEPSSDVGVAAISAAPAIAEHTNARYPVARDAAPSALMRPVAEADPRAGPMGAQLSAFSAPLASAHLALSASAQGPIAAMTPRPAAGPAAALHPRAAAGYDPSKLHAAVSLFELGKPVADGVASTPASVLWHPSLLYAAQSGYPQASSTLGIDDLARLAGGRVSAAPMPLVSSSLASAYQSANPYSLPQPLLLNAHYPMWGQHQGIAPLADPRLRPGVGYPPGMMLDGHSSLLPGQGLPNPTTPMGSLSHASAVNYVLPSQLPQPSPYATPMYYAPPVNWIGGAGGPTPMHPPSMPLGPMYSLPPSSAALGAVARGPDNALSGQLASARSLPDGYYSPYAPWMMPSAAKLPAAAVSAAGGPACVSSTLPG